jgi:hypothetical protein
MRAAFIWITVAALVSAFVSQLLGWESIRTGILIAWVVLVLLVVMTRGMRWTSVLAYLSAASLLATIIQVPGFPSDRSWFLLAWAVFVLPVAIGLFSHPMRGPAWGLFIGFWGVVGALWLIVLQILAVAGLLSGDAAWPLALLGIWFLVASSLGFGAERFPRWIDGLGMIAGAGLLAISVTTWISASQDVIRAVGLFATIAYCLWAASLGSIFWGTQHVTRRFRGLAHEGAV